MTTTSRRDVSLLATVVICLALLAAACSSSDPATSTGSGGGGTTVPASAEADAAMTKLVDAATAEGKVTVYSSQGLDQLNALAAGFEAKYPGIAVDAIRLSDGDAIPRIETELSTNTPGADLVVMAALQWINTQADAGSFVAATASPQVAGLGAYDAKQYVHPGNQFEVGAAVLTYGWNTDSLPDGIGDYPDLLDPELKGGKIAVVDPAAGPAVVDFYLWLNETYGDDFMEKLAAQEPLIYPSALPIGEALTSGEVIAAAYAAPVQLEPAKEKGAPVDFGISEKGAWGARYFAAIPKSAANPAAGALFADYMLSPEGQELVQGASGSVLPDIPGTLITNDKVRKMDLEATTPEKVTAFQEEWNALFH